MRKPAINPHDGKILVDIPLDDRPARGGARRRIVVTEEVIAEYLQTPVSQIGAHNFERFVHNNIDLICRRAVEQNNADTINHLVEIDDARPGLVDLIILRRI